MIYEFGAVSATLVDNARVDIRQRSEGADDVVINISLSAARVIAKQLDDLIAKHEGQKA